MGSSGGDMCKGLVRLETLMREWVDQSRALLPTVPMSQRKHLYSWLVKLQCGERTPSSMRLRAEYLRYMVAGLADGMVLPPFTGPPPLTGLQHLGNLLPKMVYVDILSYIDRIINETSPVKDTPPFDEEQEDMDWELRPENFFESMPRPRDGVFCYCCVFGNDEN